MKFILEVDTALGSIAGAEAEELGRILRYWAGNLKHYPMDAASNEIIYDSNYEAVGSWRLEE